MPAFLWYYRDSNLGHTDFQSDALPTELEQSNLIEDNQTLYLFRHTEAIDVFQRTRSLTKLQQVMGHSNMTVSLGYLRNLELPTLTMEDMPVLNHG